MLELPKENKRNYTASGTILSCYPFLILMVKRKPILLIDESDDSTIAVDLFKRWGIEYVEYNDHLVAPQTESSMQAQNAPVANKPTTK